MRAEARIFFDAFGVSFGAQRRKAAAQLAPEFERNSVVLAGFQPDLGEPLNFRHAVFQIHADRIDCSGFCPALELDQRVESTP